MCSNYKPVTLEDRLLAHFGVERPETEAPPEITWPGYVAPFVVRPAHRAELLQLLVGQYGLVPHWAPNLAYGRKTYNCRSETASEKPSFREAWHKGRHCIIPAEEIYELCYETGSPVRWAITQNDGPMGIAGLWGMWPDPKSGKRIPTFTMLTVNADGHAIFQRMHKPEDEKRMPVILPRKDYYAWLDCPPGQAERYMKQFPAEWLLAEPSPVPSKPKSESLPRARPASTASNEEDTGSPH